jgi:hypothetical protein
MAFNQPPNTPPGPAAPPAPPTGRSMTLAQASAMGTTQGAPVMQIAKGPPAGSGLPGSGPPPAQPGQDQQPPGVTATTPAAGGPKVANPVVAPHRGQPSVGTHPSKSPNKQVNPVHGMFK